MRRLAIVPVLGAMLLAPTSATARSSETAHVAIVSKGLRVSLSLPRKHYPVNAIVPATMSVTNVTTHSIKLAKVDFYGCAGTFAPQAVVMSHRTQVFPPIVLGTAFPSCPPPRFTPLVLRSGATLTRTELLVLRGPQVRAFVLPVTSLRLGVQQQSPEVGTPILNVTLTPSDAPKVRVQGGNVPIARVIRPTYARGALMVGNGWSRLAKHGKVGQRGFVGILEFGNGWSAARSLVIRPRLMTGYTRFVEWHILVGWPGHSAANVDFHQP